MAVEDVVTTLFMLRAKRWLTPKKIKQTCVKFQHICSFVADERQGLKLKFPDLTTKDITAN